MANALSNISNYLSGGQLGQSTSDYQQAVNTLASAVPPQLANLIPALHLQVMQGQMTPAQAQAAIQQQSSMAGVQVDPTAAAAQLKALTQLQQVASSGGLTNADKAQINQIQQQVGMQNKARQGAVLDQAQQRGIGGSGLSLAAQLSGEQSANVAASDASNNVAEDAQNRALQAMGASGNLGGQIQQQNFNEDATKANAQDIINRFNAGNLQTTNEANAQRQQQAGGENFQTANTIAGNNTGIQNAQALLPLNTAVTQGQLNNQYAKNLAGGLTAAGEAAQKAGTAQSTTSGNMLGVAGKAVGGAIGSGIKAYDTSGGDWGSTLGGAIGGLFSDPKTKTDVKDLTDDDMDSMLEKLSGKKFKYKKGTPGDDGKEHMGVMTTDLKKTPLKDNVVHSDQGDVVIDNDRMEGVMLAALNNLHNRIGLLEDERN